MSGHPTGFACPDCEKTDALRVEMVTETFQYGADPNGVMLSATVPQYTCDHCTFRFTDSEAEELRDAAVQEHLKQRFKEWRTHPKAHTRIKFAPVDAVSELQPEIDRIVAAVRSVCGIGGVLVTDESCLTDFRPLEMSTIEFEQRIAAALETSVDISNPGDNFLVRLALRLRRTAEG